MCNYLSNATPLTPRRLKGRRETDARKHMESTRQLHLRVYVCAFVHVRGFVVASACLDVNESCVNESGVPYAAFVHSTNRSRPSDIYLRVSLHCSQWPSMYIHARLVHMLSVGFHAKDPTAVGVAEIAVQLFIRTQVDACSQLLWQVRCLCFFLLFSTSASPPLFPSPCTLYVIST